MHKATFRYRLYPTAAQATAMQATLNECRWLYNRLLEERKLAWEGAGTGVRLYDQVNRIPVLKAERPTLGDVHSQVLQNVATRIEVAFQAFFRRVKAGETAGYLRFRGAGWYDSFCYPGSGHRVDAHGTIAVEELSVNRMVHNHCLAKSISDAAWSLFISLLRYKAANAGRRMVEVNPAYTSQTCSRCGHRQKMPLAARVYRCPCCHLELSRDVNAACNILALGLQGIGEGP